MLKWLDDHPFGTLGAIFAAIAGIPIVALASLQLAFGQAAPNATGFGGNPWQQVGQHMAAGGGAPVLTGTNCGQAGTVGLTGVIPGASDMSGTIVNGTATSGCVLTFNQAWNSIPTCIIQDATTAADSAGVLVSRTAITFGTIVSGDLLKWICIGQPGG